MTGNHLCFADDLQYLLAFLDKDLPTVLPVSYAITEDFIAPMLDRLRSQLAQLGARGVLVI